MEITKLIKEYQQLNLSQTLNYDKFNLYAITHHSTSIEGSTLTSLETDLLLDEGLSPKGKPLEHSLMTTDHAAALNYTIEEAEKKTIISPTLIKSINAKVMRTTGKTYQTIFGEIDAAKGDFRKGNVVAGKRYFPNFDKVENLTEQLCKHIVSQLKINVLIIDQLHLSFDAHFELVSVHPFYDGNGRTSRLLMNYIQRYYQLPIGMVFKEDKLEYIAALEESRDKETKNPFRDFMISQYKKQLTQEIKNFQSIQ